MAIEFTSVDEAIEDTGLKILVHGQAGSGKTVFSATAGKPTIIINAEAGLLSIKGAPSFIKTVRVTNIDQLQEVYDFLADSEEPVCDWVCLDSISDIAEVVLSEEKETSTDPRQAYGELADRMFKLLRMFRDLEGYNVLMTAKQVRVEDQDTNRTMYYPMLPGKQLTFGISYLFDEVFALRLDRDKAGNQVRQLQTERDAQYDCKDRSGDLDAFEPVNLKHIEKKIMGDDYVAYKKPVKTIETETEVETKVEEEKELEIQEGFERGLSPDLEELENFAEEIEEETKDKIAI